MSEPMHTPETNSEDPEVEHLLALLDAPQDDAPISELELLTGEALVGWLGDEPQLDPDLQAKLTHDAARFFAAPGQQAKSGQALPTPLPRTAAQAPSPGLSKAGWGWLLAALLLFSLGVGRWGGSAPAREPVSLQDQLASAPDRVELSFGVTDDGTQTLGAVEGAVVWSASRQQGYMKFRGLPKNAPQEAQYQLWIVDPSRPSFDRVDGGVFDVTADGDVVIPIDAKLPIKQAAAFAITLEEPGGVVVSGGPLLLVAAP